ncbi:MAG: hypothetical protein LC789_06160 [Actinobacteria bacterium]|nr:hypothetical protein [Actinomycetota bacterium]MCA1720263.1 hypothetical protein [Actinomycetota bacterium]
MKRLALLGLLALELVVADAYYARGTWWHFLLHQFVGWGLGLSVAALLRLPAVPAMVGGQLVSIFPDLMFRFMRMPHEPYMDWWVGHISMHRGPSPMLVGFAVLVLGGLGWFLAPRRAAVVVALSGPVLLLVACLLASPIPSKLSDY